MDGKENSALNTEMNWEKKTTITAKDEGEEKEEKKKHMLKEYISERRGKQLRAIRMVKLFHFVIRSLHIAFVIRWIEWFWPNNTN